MYCQRHKHGFEEDCVCCEVVKEVYDKDKRIKELEAAFKQETRIALHYQNKMSELLKEVGEMKTALEFYRTLVSDCNRHGKEGDIARDRLAKDSGKKAKQALNTPEKG